MEKRFDGRNYNEMRTIKITKDYLMHPEGSVLIEMGNTKVICTATIEDKVPPFQKGTGQGWVTAEYSMLPRATGVRNIRESAKGKLGGRTHEIQRLIGRSLRSVVDLHALGEKTIWLDCDVIQADGGTRTASISGAFVAMILAMEKLVQTGELKKIPVSDYLAAVSVGKVDGQIHLDLCYQEDSKAEVDMNVVMTQTGKFIEVQGTAEEDPFTRDELNQMLEYAEEGIKQIISSQSNIIGHIFP